MSRERARAPCTPPTCRVVAPFTRAVRAPAAAAEMSFKELKTLLSHSAQQMRDKKLETEAKKNVTKAKALKAFGS